MNLVPTTSSSLLLLLVIIVAVLVSSSSLVSALTTVSPTCISGPTGPNDQCQIDNTHLTGDTTFELAGPASYGTLTVRGAGVASGIALTLRNSLTINTLALDSTSVLSITVDTCTIVNALTGGGAFDIAASSLTFTGATIGSTSVTSAIQFSISSSFAMTTTTLRSSVGGVALAVRPSTTGATVNIASNTITHTCTSNQCVGLAVYPTTVGSVFPGTITIASNTISETASGSASTGVGIRVSSSDGATTTPMQINAAASITANKINVTSTGATTTGVALDVVIGCSTTTPTVTLSSNIIGVIVSGSGRANGVWVYGSSCSYFYGTSLNVYVDNTGTGNARGVIIRGATNSASLNFVYSYVRTITRGASAAAIGFVFDNAISVASNFELRFHEFDQLVTSVSSTAHAFTAPSAFANSKIYIGNSSATAATGFFSATLPTSSTGDSLLFFRCTTANGALLTSSDFSTSYTQYVACGTCDYTADCNGGSTAIVTLDSSNGQCICGCNADASQTGWLPLSGQCPGALASTTQSTTTTTTSTTITSTSTTTTTTTTPIPTLLLIQDDSSGLSYDAVLGLSIMGIILGLILIVVLICCCCHYCRKKREEEEERKRQEQEQQQDEQYYEDEDANNPAFAKGVVVRNEDGAMLLGDGKKPRPEPPLPHEILELRRLKYQNLRDKRAIEAHEEEAKALEEQGFHQRAADLRAEIALMQKDIQQRNRSISRNDDRDEVESLERDGDPDIALTTDDEGQGASDVDNYQRRKTMRSKSRDHPEFKARIALVVGEDDPRLGSGLPPRGPSRSLSHQQQQNENSAFDRPRLGRTSPFKFASNSGQNTPNNTAAGLITSKDSVGMVAASNDGPQSLHVIGIRDEDEPAPALAARSRTPQHQQSSNANLQSPDSTSYTEPKIRATAISVPEQRSRALPITTSANNNNNNNISMDRSGSRLQHTAAHYMEESKRGGSTGGTSTNKSQSRAPTDATNSSPAATHPENAPFGSQLSPDGVARAPTSSSLSGGYYARNVNAATASNASSSEPFNEAAANDAGSENSHPNNNGKRFGQTPNYGRPNGTAAIIREPKALQQRSSQPPSAGALSRWRGQP